MMGNSCYNCCCNHEDEYEKDILKNIEAQKSKLDDSEYKVKLWTKRKDEILKEYNEGEINQNLKIMINEIAMCDSRISYWESQVVASKLCIENCRNRYIKTFGNTERIRATMIDRLTVQSDNSLSR